MTGSVASPPHILSVQELLMITSDGLNIVKRQSHLKHAFPICSPLVAQHVLTKRTIVYGHVYSNKFIW